jgi:hypothetical protein
MYNYVVHTMHLHTYTLHYVKCINKLLGSNRNTKTQKHKHKR